ncbi:restriction endonuclease subunit S [Methylotenera versatilis]|uniref:restriction endonuclease subunit S n=1 Tax=Methylotenera versatilis TaxID=1055487 RepID=UPI0006902F35|nr:restriction endonuclease subunit S [Methylotenera versatilis]
MAGFELSAGANANKVFLANHSELAERFDPEMVSYNKKVKQFKYATKPLKSLLLTSPQYGANESGITRNSAQSPRYVRITDINEYGNLIDGLGVTAETVEKKYILNNNDLLFARSGNTVGKTYLHKSDAVSYSCFFAGYMIRFVVDSKKILSDFLFLYTQLAPYKDWVKAVQRTAGQPNINAEEYKSLLIPLPDLATQEKFVDKYQQAEQAKQQKEEQAQALLDSIDGYLLGELGITLTEQDNHLEKRIFTVLFSEVTGGRLDPDICFTKHYKIEGGSYANSPLHKLAHVNKGQSITSNHIIAGKYPVIAGGQSSPYSHNAFNYEGNIITVSASGAYAGFVWYHDYPIFASDCSVIQSKDEEILNTLYLAELLKTKQKEIYNLQQGAGQPHVYSRDLMQLNIPLPHISKQNEIATHIAQIRAQAKQLQTEAENIIKTAKTEIESMILGDPA